MNRTMIYILLAVLCGLMFFWRLGSAPVMFFDEGLYSECAREMLASGDYVVPRVDGEYFFDKPPLCYWAQAGSMRLLGVNALGAQLPSALSALLMVGWTVFLGNKLFGKRAGVFAGFALASSMLCVAVAHMGIMDNAFSLMISLALGAFLLSYLGIWPRWGYIGSWAAMGLASLIKGPAGIALILAAAGMYYVKAWKSYVKLRPADDDKTGQAALFAGVWLVTIIGLFSLAVSKLMGYILPAFPAAALLVGLLWSKVIESGKTASLKSSAIWSFAIATFLAVVFVIVPKYLPRPIPGLTAALIPMSICMFAGPAIALVMVYKNRAGAAFASLCAGISGFLLLAVWLGLPIASRTMADPMVNMSAKIKAQAPASAFIVTINIDPPQPAFAFYAERPMPDLDVKIYKDRAKLRALLASAKTLYVVAQENKLDGLPEGGKLEAQSPPYLLYKFGSQ
ncbi:MAG: glycosyltransferase family 39 protein [Armatimonadetes bacterium]|nr:glycosyltransferase family 39 protein [Armatimonadota bacterium]